MTTHSIGKVLSGPVLIFALVGCQPPWAAPGAHINTKAWSPQEAFDCIKKTHDKDFPTDPIKVVHQALILKQQKNGLGSMEAWTIETKSGAWIEYTLRVAHFERGLTEDITYYAVLGERRLR